MKFFVTGATGYIGGAVVAALLEGGHEVTGLARTPEKSAALKDAGAKAVRGNLSDPSTFRSAAAGHDGLIHLGFEMSQEGVDIDRRAIEALLDLAASDPVTRVAIYTSGVMVLGNTGDSPADEAASTDHPAAAVGWRPAHEQLVLDAATESLATAVIRPGMVYGGKGGSIGQFFQSCKDSGAALYIGDGKNRWPLVHRDDLADLYWIVAEQAAQGIFHGVDDTALMVAEIARAASEAAGTRGAIKSLPIEEARRQMGPFADAMCLDQVVTAERSKDIGWAPGHPPFTVSAAEAYLEWRD